MKKAHTKLPFIGRLVLKRMDRYDYDFSISGDIKEEYEEKITDLGIVRATYWLWVQIAMSMFRYVLFSFKRNTTMLKNYLKIAARNIIRHKSYTLLNVSGLVIGMSCFLLTLLYVQHENNYDRFHRDGDRIYRVVHGVQDSDGIYWGGAISPMGYGPTMFNYFSEIESFSRIFYAVLSSNTLFSYGDKEFYEEKGVYADSTFFDFFGFELKQGNPDDALKVRNSIVLTEKLAKKYFNDENPINKVITYNNDIDLTVTGVIKSKRYTSHITFDYLISFSTLPRERGYLTASKYFTYLKLNENVQKEQIEDRVDNYLRENISESAAQNTSIRLQKLSEIHLQSRLSYDFPGGGNKSNLYVLSVIAFFVLLIACINFVNLSTARYTKRNREVGVRKVLGAVKKQLVGQFLFESILISAIAFVLTLAVLQVIIPVVNEGINKNIILSFTDTPLTLLISAGFAVLVGVFSGIYPAFVLTNFEPASVLNGSSNGGMSKEMMRKSLVVVQYTISIGLIIGSGIMFQQQRFIQTKDLGFNKEQVINIPVRDREMSAKLPHLKQELTQFRGVIDASASTAIPGFGEWGTTVTINQTERRVFSSIILVDADYFDLMQIEVLRGRNFSEEATSDVNRTMIINETAAELYGLENPVGERLNIWGNDREIIGVVKDFHFRSFQEQIGPMIFWQAPGRYMTVSAKIAPTNIAETLAMIRDTWSKFDPANPMTYEFLDESFGRLHAENERQNTMVLYLTLLSILISCLGLYGLVSYVTDTRKKEIAIRKALGASSDSIFYLLSQDFMKWIAAANLIAWPLVYYFISEYWLTKFFYRIEIGIQVFLAGAVMSLLIALLTISYQSIKASFTNPVNALKYE